MTGVELTSFCTALNGDATIDADLLDVLVDNVKTTIERKRPWMVLRKTDSSKTVTTSNTWQTAIDLSTITDFTRFYMNQDGVVIKLFDGDNRIDYITLKPFDQRLEWKNVSGTCVYDAANKTLYINGTVPFAGTLYIPYIKKASDIDLAANDDVWTEFGDFVSILGYGAVGIYKGGIDFDSINKAMLPTNDQTFMDLLNAMESWDNEMQLASIQSNDPSEFPGGTPRGGAINRYDS